MVVVQRAHPTLRAVTITNTKPCCRTRVPLEYAGDIMGPGQPDNHDHGSDRRLRPRTQTACPRCKRTLASNAKCPCNVRDGDGKKAAGRAVKVEDTGQMYRLSMQGFAADTFTSNLVPSASPNATTSLSRAHPELTYRPQFTAAPSPPLHRPSSPQPSTSHTTSPRPSTSYDSSSPICDTPKRVVPLRRRCIFPVTAVSVEGFHLVTKTIGKRPGAAVVAARGRSPATPPAAKNGNNARGKRTEGSKVPAKGKARVLPAAGGRPRSYLLIPQEEAPARVRPAGPPPAPHPEKLLKPKNPAAEATQTHQCIGEFPAGQRLFPGSERPSVGAGEASPALRTPPRQQQPSPASSHQQTPRSGGGRHVCRECGKSFASPGKLTQHLFIHTGERPFPCDQCSKAFSTKFKLVRHNLIHSTERRFVCKECNRQFHRKDHLQNHAKIHSTVKLKFVCDRPGCSKEYGSANSARKHSAAHAAQDGRLDCVLCGRSFASTPEVLHHLKVHAGSRAVKTPADRKFRCEHCDRKFFTRKDVRRHLVVHTGLRDFLCPLCPQRFGRKDHLVRHIKKSHQGGRAKGGKKRAPRRAAAPPPPPPRPPSRPPTPETPGEILGYVALPSPASETSYKHDTSELSYPSTSSVKVESVPQFEIEDSDMISMYVPPTPYPAAKSHEDLNLHYYAMDDPDIQKFFTSDTDNGHLLMHLMDTVQMSAANHNSHDMQMRDQDDHDMEMRDRNDRDMEMRDRNDRDMEMRDRNDHEMQMRDPLQLSQEEHEGMMGGEDGGGEEMMSSQDVDGTVSAMLELRESPAMAEEILGVSARDDSLTMDSLLRDEHGMAPLPRFNQAFPQSPQDF